MAVPMFNEHPIEMGHEGTTRPEIVGRFADRTADGRTVHAGVSRRSPSRLTLANIVNAIAAFERTLLSADSPFDRYLYRDDRTRLVAGGRARHDALLLEDVSAAASVTPASTFPAR